MGRAESTPRVEENPGSVFGKGVKYWRGKESSSTRVDGKKAKYGQGRAHTAPKIKPKAKGTGCKLKNDGEGEQRAEYFQ